MTAVVQVIERDGEMRVSSEAVAGGSGVQHKNVLELILSNITDLAEFGEVAFETRPGYNNSPVRFALLNEQQATLLMTFQRNTPQVREFKKVLVRTFFEMGRKLAALAVPQTLPEALRAYAAEVEQREALQAKVAMDAPKVLFADAVATADTDILVGDLAKILRGNGIPVGANRLFDMLRTDGFLIRRRGTDWNMPTQRSMELGLFRVKETAVTHSDGHVTISKTPKVTGKGQAYFVNRYAARPVGVAS